MQPPFLGRNRNLPSEDSHVREETMARKKVAILGPGNIGIDLMQKIRSRSRSMELVLMAGIEPASIGLAMARELGIDTSHDGVEAVLGRTDLDFVFECTSARSHAANAPRYAAKGLKAIDLTPAAVGSYVVPSVNIADAFGVPNVNLVTCGGQATIPIVHAANRVQPVLYAEIVATISSRSAGPGTRANIDEFTVTSKRAVERVGGAREAKALILLNPAEPPILMRNTVFLRIEKPDREALSASIARMEAEVRAYVPGYRIILGPLVDGDKVTVILQVEGAGDYLPPYAGNLDIITSAAVRIGDLLAEGPAGNGTGADSTEGTAAPDACGTVRMTGPADAVRKTGGAR